MSTDRELQNQVLDELRWEKLVDPAALSVEVREGYVTLAGQVASEEVRSAAEWAARRVAGIRGVECDITVVPAPPPRIIQ
ncbi:MAG TPA: BON domain-containing protein [Steroidobacteraceae bacterium]|nr:BON domain-containing protein [Steroidobacteraceae bacterium]